MQKSLSTLSTQRLATAILFVLLFAMAVRIPVDTDTWWHLRTGEYILANRAVPLTDPFSLTRLNQPWVDHSWGSQLIMVAFYRLGGNTGLAIYTALLATAGMYFVFLMCEGNVFLRAFVIVLAAAAAAVFWSARPQMTSVFLSTVVLFILYLYKRRHVDRLWLIPVIMVVWVNLHAGFFIAFLLLTGMIVGETIGRLWDNKNPNVLTWPRIRKLILITAIAFVLLILNPNTIQMWTYSFRTIGIGALQNYIQEWASPDFHGHETWPFVFMLLGVLAAVGLGSKRLDWTDLILASGLTFLALYAGRNISTFAIVAGPVLSRHLDALLRDRGLVLARSRPPRGVALGINWAVLVLIVIAALVKIAVTLNPKAVADAQATYLPVKAAIYLNDAKPSGPMFNSYNWGGYLMFAVPQIPVFVDGRTDLYDDTLLNEWLNTTQAHNWRETFDKWHIQLVVIEHDSPLAGALREQSDWREVYADSQASIFEQKAAS
jgi:hypothetical protein